MQEEEKFIIRAYDKSELALLYCPGREPTTALQNLYRWMKRNPGLNQALEAAE